MNPADSGTAPQGKPRILVVEDDRAFRSVIARVLERGGFSILEAADGTTGLELAMNEKPDLVILDVVLPDRSGIEVCRELRRLQFDAAILMLTGQNDIDDRVTGLEAGADDYLGKPFNDRELMARVAAQLRRLERIESRPTHITLGDVTIDFERRVATRGDETLRLTKTEFLLLELLAAQAGRPVSRRTVLQVVWGYARTPDTRTVDTHVWRLRKKLGDSGTEPRWIRSAGGGYTLVLDETSG